MAWTTPSSITTGTLVTASRWNTDVVDNLIYLKSVADQTGRFYFVPKTSDETLSASTTLQDDNLLLWSVSVSEKWHFELTLYIQAAANASAMDYKHGWSYPSGTTIRWGRMSTADTSIAAFTGGATTVSVPGLDTETDVAAVGLSANSPGVQGVRIAGRVLVGGTAGTVNYRWCQNTSNASDLTVMAGSNLRLYKYS